MKFNILFLILSMVPVLSVAQSKWSCSVFGGATVVRQKNALRDMNYEYYGPAYEINIGPYSHKINSYSPAIGVKIRCTLKPRIHIVSGLGASYVRGKILRSIYSKPDGEFLKTYKTYSRQVSLRGNLGAEYRLKKWPVSLSGGVSLEYLSMPDFQSPDYEYINTNITRQIAPGLLLGIGYWPPRFKDRIGINYSVEGLFPSQTRQSILTLGEHPHIFEMESKFRYHSLCIEFFL